MSEELREIFENAPPKAVERRHGVDLRLKAAIATSVPAWVLLMAGAYALSLAMPESKTLFDSIYQKTVRTYWASEYLYNAAYLWAVGAVCSLGSGALFWKRTRRRGDHAQLSAYIGFGLCAAALVLLLLFMQAEGF